MHEALKVVFVALTVTVLAGSACTARSKRGELSQRRILQLAVAAANQEAKHIYDIQPFELEGGQLTTNRELWKWGALTSSDGFDFVARVELARDGAVSTVDVNMLSHTVDPSPDEVQILPAPEPLRPAEIIEK